jgi:hypothetical protein
MAKPISEKNLKRQRSDKNIETIDESNVPEIEIDPLKIKIQKIGKKRRFYRITVLGEKNLISKKSFYDASNFFDAYAPVKYKRNGSFEIIDCFGNVITSNIEDFTSIGEFHEGLATVRNPKSKFVGYINIYARHIIDLERIFPDITFKEGSDFADSKAYLFLNDGGYVQIDTVGRVMRVFKPKL